MYRKGIVVLSLSVSLIFCLTIAGIAHGKMVGYWPLEEIGAGNKVEDKSGSGNDGVLKGTAKVVKGKVGNAFEFDGVSGWVDCGDDASLQPLGPMTCMFWFTPLTEIKAGLPRWNLVYFAYGPMFRTLDDGTIQTWMDLSGDPPNSVVISAQNSWPVGEWVHMACVYERDLALIYYINGEEEGRKIAKNDIKTPRAGFFGIGGVDWGAYCHAIFDEVKYYDEALTAQQISQEYRAVTAVEHQDKLTSRWGEIKGR